MLVCSEKYTAYSLEYNYICQLKLNEICANLCETLEERQQHLNVLV